MKVLFGKQTLEVSVADDFSIAHVKAILTQETGLDTIRLVSGGKTLSDETTVRMLPGGIYSKITMIASHSNEHVTTPSTTIRIKDDLTIVKSTPKLLNTKPVIREFVKDGYGFHGIKTLPGLPEEDKAREILETLASDPGFLAVMKKHGWNVGCLGELYPEGYVGVSEVCVLGLNKNMGQEILLRIRTDDLKGFRKMLNIREVLCHELSHMVNSDHDDKFYMLMRQIQKEVLELDWTKSNFRTLGEVRRYPTQWNDSEESLSDDEMHVEPSSVEPLQNFIEQEKNIDLSKVSEEIRSEQRSFDEEEQINQSNILASRSIIEDYSDQSKNTEYSTENSEPVSQAQNSVVQNRVSLKASLEALDSATAAALAQESVLSQEKVLNFIETLRSITHLYESKLSADNQGNNLVYDEWKWSFELVLKVLSNVKDINDEKVKTLRKDTKSFQRLMVATDQIAKESLRLAGFNDEGQFIRIKNIDPGFLYFATEIIKSALQPDLGMVQVV